jgi:hypothetical protein
MKEPISYLREATVTLVPTFTDEQLDRIAAELAALQNPYLQVRRIGEHTALVQGIPVKAASSQEADALTWQTIYTHIRSALTQPWDRNTSITAIELREPDSALASDASGDPAERSVLGTHTQRRVRVAAPARDIEL